MTDDEMVRCAAVSELGVRCQRRFPVRFLDADGTGHAGGHCYATDEVWERLTNDHITGLEATKAIAGLPFATHPAEDCNSRCDPLPCACPELHVGSDPSGTRNWNPDCVAHGTASSWYQHPDQVAERNNSNARLEAMYAEVRRVREGGTPVAPCQNCGTRHFEWDHGACDAYRPDTA